MQFDVVVVNWVATVHPTTFEHTAPRSVYPVGQAQAPLMRTNINVGSQAKHLLVELVNALSTCVQYN
jgi:hypothetical protein